MRKVIIYSSSHHNNTKKLLEKVLEKLNDIDLININNIEKFDLTSYETIGFASGIYFGKFHKKIIEFINNYNFENKKIFLLYTSGSGFCNYARKIKKELIKKNICYLGDFSCRGYDTYGFWGKIGGISKNRPNEKDINKCIKFILSLG